MRNFNFIICKKKHEDYYWIYYTQNPYQRRTVSYNISHELLHQIGNAIYYGSHSDHDIVKCVLNPSYIFYSGSSPEFINGRMIWIVCFKTF